MTDEKETDNDVEEENVNNEEEIVEDIEEETSGSLLSDFSRESVLAGGILLGIAVGLITGYALTAAGPGEAQEATPAEIQENLEMILTGGDESLADEMEVSEPERRNGMYYATFSAEVEQPADEDGNETEIVDQEQGVFVSIDGDLIFPEQPGVSPIETSEALAMLEQQPEAPAPEGGEEDIDEELEEEIEEQLEEEASEEE